MIYSELGAHKGESLCAARWHLAPRSRFLLVLIKGVIKGESARAHEKQSGQPFEWARAEWSPGAALTLTRQPATCAI